MTASVHGRRRQVTRESKCVLRLKSKCIATSLNWLHTWLKTTGHLEKDFAHYFADNRSNFRLELTVQAIINF